MYTTLQKLSVQVCDLRHQMTAGAHVSVSMLYSQTAVTVTGYQYLDD